MRGRLVWRVLTASLVAFAVSGVGIASAAQDAPSAGTAPPVINGLTATPATVSDVGGSSVLTASVSAAKSCHVTATPAVLSGTGPVACNAKAMADPVLFPTNALATVYKLTLTAKNAGGSAKAVVKVKVRAGAGGGLSGVRSLASDGDGSCAVLASRGVVCWGYAPNGQLGDGQMYMANPFGASVPVQVEGVGGSGTLGGVASVVSTGSGYGYCALLTSSGVDCWGFDQVGSLGDGQWTDSATPVQVVGTDGTGALTGVDSLASDGLGYCAVLASGMVDCWGYGPNGELGDGQFHSAAPFGSSTPVPVLSVDGTDVLSGVASLASDGEGYCALLTSGGVDCWGAGETGELGNGQFYASPDGSALPVVVVGVSGNGMLAGVVGLSGIATHGYCAQLVTGGVDCWGVGASGELGNGQFSSSGSATPVPVVATSGGGILLGVSSVTSDQDGYCAIVAAGNVVCWGNGAHGLLGDGQTAAAATPVSVENAAGTGNLHGVSDLTTDGDGFCAVMASTAVQCWGAGSEGDLGDGRFYGSAPGGSAIPVQVQSPSGSGALTGVAGLSGEGDGYCALLATTEVDCWGAGEYGNLGNGQFYGSSPFGAATPVQVV